MLVVTAKVTKRKAVVGAVAVGLAVCALILLRGNAGQQWVDTGSESAPGLTTCTLKSAEDRVQFLQGLGWKIREEPIEFMEVRIPEEFDETYQRYNEVQIAQGLDLRKYAGKRVMRYSYQLLEHPSGEEGVIANLLIYKNHLIGGDISSPKLDGFLNGLQQE